MEFTRSLRRVGTVALAEARRTGGSFNKRTLAAMGALGVATALLTPLLLAEGFQFDDGLYRAAVEPGSVLEAPLRGARPFVVVPTGDALALLAAGEVDVAVRGMELSAHDTPKGHAALAAVRQAAREHTYAHMLQEPDQDAAFPVRVVLRYEDQARTPEPLASPGGGSGAAAPPPSDPGAPSGGATGGGSPAPATPPAGAPADGFTFLPASRSVNTPETLAPPFPFRSLILAYAFLIPMNFVVQVYAGSAIAERLGRRGEALLASPARPWEIITGKALPYLLLMMVVSAGIVIWIGAGWLSLLAVAPLAFAFLALEFVAAMYARSFRELTFFTVFSSVMVTIYAFLPAVFSDVHPVALVSPITLVVFDLRGEAVGLTEILYATLPLTLFSLALFVLGAALYREEDLFHQKLVRSKLVDSIARQIRSLRSALWIPILLLPFVFVAELLLVTFLFAWPVPVGLAGALVAVALVEESFKALPSYAGIRRGVVPATSAVAFGALVGVGFFLGEKGFLLASLAGLMDVPAGAAVFGSAGSTSLVAGGLLLMALLLGPLLLHVVTAALTAWGARQGGHTFALSFGGAVAIHTAYNMTVVLVFQGGQALLGGGAP